MVTVKKTYGKVIFREIRGSFSRFMAIFAIVALGVGFLAGLLATTPDMRYSADLYYKKTNTMDLRILSTVGLSQDDIDAIADMDGVGEVMPAYSTDVLLLSPDDNTMLARMHSLPFQDKDGPYLNRVEVVEGRLPEAANECVLESVIIGDNPLALGETLRLSAENADMSDTLAQTAFTVVGYVQSAYYMSLEREPSKLGDGSVDMVAYTLPETFSMDIYTDAFVRVAGGEDVNTFSDDYDAVIRPVQDALEKFGETQVLVRYQEVMDEANAKLSEAKQEYEDGKAKSDKELADAAQKLADAEKQIADGEQELEDGRQQIADGEKQLEDGKKQLEKGWKAYEENRETLRQGEEDLQSQRLQFALTIIQKQQELSNAKQELASAKNTLDQANTQLTATRLFLDTAQAAIDDAVAQGVLTEEQAVQAREKLQPQEEEYAAGKKAYDEGMAAYTENAQKVADGEAALAEGQKTAEAEFAKAEKKLEDGKAQLAEAKTTLDKSETDIEENDAKLAQSRLDIEQGEQELADAKEELEKGRQDYEAGKQEAEEKLADARRQIADAEIKLADMASPKWYVLDRDDNVSFSGFEGNANKIDAIAQVFPVFFFLVAALVALTTMTRMIEEERTQIGTMKALGYGKGKIMLKYIIYAGAATLTGSLFGLIAGFQVLPHVIWNAYGILYNLPPFYAFFNVPYAVVSSAAAFLCTMIATISACYGTLKESPARLMLPRAPKAGKRVFLEKIPFIWNHLTFTHKVTARNLIRYKKRFFMTVIGIAGCTALLLTGFGLRDSISDIVDKQFGELYQYNLIISLKNADVPDTDEDVKAVLNNKERVSDYMAAHQENGTLHTEKGSKDAYLYVPKETARFREFLTMRERRSGKEVTFGSGVLVTEKLAETMGVKTGDSIEVENADGTTAQLPVSGIIENYVNGYIYIPAALYASAFGAEPDYTQLLVKVPDDSQANREAISYDLLKSSYVNGAQFTTSLSKSFADVIKSIDYIVMVLIVCAGLLAFVVLYNLTNINITERQKEIATIKVLGFYNKEVSAYIYRETAILSIIGTLVGLVLGIFLHAFVVKTAEVDMVMFGRSIGWLSFVLAAVLTLFFSLLVNLVMYRKLKNVDMVESMKAGE